MRRYRSLLVPLALAWFAGALWWIGHQSACGCAAKDRWNAGVAMAPFTSSDPLGDPITSTATAGVALDAPLRIDTPLLPLIVPFVKNEHDPAFNPAMEQRLTVLLSHLRANAAASIIVTGHTDGDGDEDLNRRLSRERAERMKRLLVARGFSADRIRTRGMGADQPIANDRTSKGKAQNRRVEIAISEEPSPTSPPHDQPDR